MEIKLIVNSQETIIGIETLRYLASNLSDSEANRPVFDELAKHNSAAVRSDIAYKNNISEKTVRLLLSDDSPEVLNGILNSSATQSILDKDDFDYILSRNYEEAIGTLIMYIEDFEKLDDIDRCFEDILKLDNDYLSYKVVDSFSVSENILKKLVNHKDPDIASAARSKLEDD